MSITKKQNVSLNRQPSSMESLEKFCGTKTLAKSLAISLGNALMDSDNARKRGDSDDTEFELMFWYGNLFLDDDDLYDAGINDAYLTDYSDAYTYDERLDATFYLCFYRGRKFIAVRYEFKDDYAVSAWWLEGK